MLILIVEDHPLLARMMQTAVGAIRPDAELRVVHCLADARLTIETSEAPDCILTDLGLPDADGLQAPHALRALAPRARLAITSSNDDPGLITKALADGVDAYLIKGSDLDAFEDDLKQFLLQC